jgi:hypothetical protein
MLLRLSTFSTLGLLVLNIVDEDDSEVLEAAVEEWTTVAAVFPSTPLQFEATLKASCNDLDFSLRPFTFVIAVGL